MHGGCEIVGNSAQDLRLDDAAAELDDDAGGALAGAEALEGWEAAGAVVCEDAAGACVALVAAEVVGEAAGVVVADNENERGEVSTTTLQYSATGGEEPSRRLARR